MMDDFTSEIIAQAQESPFGDSGSDSPSTSPQKQKQKQQQRKGWGGLAALREKASLQDRLVEKSVQLPQYDFQGTAALTLFRSATGFFNK